MVPTLRQFPFVGGRRLRWSFMWDMCDMWGPGSGSPPKKKNRVQVLAGQSEKGIPHCSVSPYNRERSSCLHHALAQPPTKEPSLTNPSRKNLRLEGKPPVGAHHLRWTVRAVEHNPTRRHHPVQGAKYILPWSRCRNTRTTPRTPPPPNSPRRLPQTRKKHTNAQPKRDEDFTQRKSQGNN